MTPGGGMKVGRDMFECKREGGQGVCCAVVRVVGTSNPFELQPDDSGGWRARAELAGDGEGGGAQWAAEGGARSVVVFMNKGEGVRTKVVMGGEGGEKSESASPRRSSLWSVVSSSPAQGTNHHPTCTEPGRVPIILESERYPSLLEAKSS